MKKIFGQDLDLHICTTDSETARKYHFKGSTNTLFNDELIPFHITINERSMKAFLSKKMAAESK